LPFRARRFLTIRFESIYDADEKRGPGHNNLQFVAGHEMRYSMFNGLVLAADCLRDQPQSANSIFRRIKHNRAKRVECPVTTEVVFVPNTLAIGPQNLFLNKAC